MMQHVAFGKVSSGISAAEFCEPEHCIWPSLDTTKLSGSLSYSKAHAIRVWGVAFAHTCLRRDYCSVYRPALAHARQVRSLEETVSTSPWMGRC